MSADSPPPDPATRELATQRAVLKAVIAVLVIGAGLIVLLAKSVPLPLRLFVAVTDLILAAVLGLLMRQKFGRR